MTEWRDAALGDVIELKRGYDLPKRARADGPFPIVSSSGVSGRHAEAKVEGPGVVTGRYGTLGQVFYVLSDFWPLNTSLYVRDFKGNNERFVALLLESMDLAQHDGAAAVPGLNRNQLHTVPVRIPDRSIQDRIASIVESIDDLIENNRLRVEVLEAMAKAIYREWFVHFRYPGHENATLVDSPLGPIPEGWEIVSLGEMADLGRRSVQPRRSADVEFDHFSIPAFDAGRLPSPELGETIRSGKYLVERPAVMVSKLNPRIERTWFARPSAGRTGIASTEFLILRPAGHTSLEFLYATARSATFQERLRALSGGTSTSHQRTRPGDFLQLEVLDPGAEPVARFSTAIGPALELVHELLVASRRLAALRDLLLPKLVTGQLDVSSLDLGSLVEAAGG